MPQNLETFPLHTSPTSISGHDDEDLPSAEISPHPLHRGWYQRRRLPHFDTPDRIQFVTWRLEDSVPKPLRERLEQELRSLAMPISKAEAERRRRLEELLDRGYGQCWLRRNVCAQVVRDSLLAGEGENYELHAWAIMPNHVHVLVQFLPGNRMEKVLDCWKGSTGHRINDVLERTGPVWQEDFWDRYMRDAEHYENTRHYIVMNPVKARLVTSPARWKWWWARGK